MNRWISLLLVYFLVFFSEHWILSTEYCSAGPWENLKEGDRTADELLKKVDNKKAEAGKHPFYQGLPKEQNYKESELSHQSQFLFKTDSASQMVRESSETRPHFKINPEKDPLVQGAQEIISNPLEAIGGKGTQAVMTTQGEKEEIIGCEESGDDGEYTCTSRLIVEVKEEKGPPQNKTLSISGPTVYREHSGLLNSWPRLKSRHFVAHISVGEPTLKSFLSHQAGIPLDQITSASVSHRGKWVHVGHKRYTYTTYVFSYTYVPIIKVPYFSWTNNCNELEQKADQGHCHYISKVCTQGPQTRTINGLPVTQDCWEETYTYNCEHPSKNDCGPLRAKGCVQIASTCKQKVGNACALYQQTYQCKGGTKTTHSITGGKTPFCLDGNCRDQGWEVNDEMMSTLAQLSILKELQGQFKEGSFFKGEDNRCSKQILSFKDCCGSGKGWGKDIGLAHCSSQEKLLNQRRKKGLCYFVGTYCAKKVLGQCITKKSTYCCFSSKLLKAFHEQGRPQIGMGWGKAKHPLCRGFTIEEIQKIDFSKLDLREVFEDLMKTYSPEKLKGTSNTLKERIETIQKGIRAPTQKQQVQRNEA